MPKKLTTEEFIQKAKLIHGERYEYSNVVYKSAHQKVTITCKVHGDFEQKAYCHLAGYDCMKCSIISNTERQKSNSNEFITKSKEIHGDKYDYSKVVYRTNKKKVIIICKEHGTFEQTPNNHLTGYGCNFCGYKIISNKTKSSTAEFIKAAIEIHDDLYNYANVNYINSTTPVSILCKLHGEFYQKPVHHIHHRSGCPKCRNSKAVIDIMKLLESKDIEYVTEHRFSDCKNKNTLPFDFYIQSLNLCIEYDGAQHFKPVEFWGGVEGYLKMTINDNIKNEYCSTNNIHLLRISYNQEHIKVLKDYFETKFNIIL